MLNRRKTIALLGLIPATLGLCPAALAQTDAQVLLQTRLAALRLPFAPRARLEMITFHHRQDPKGHHMQALVRLTWPPGMRQHALSAEGDNVETAVTELVAQLSRILTIAARQPGARTA